MEQLIRQILNTLAVLSNSDRLILLTIKDNRLGTIKGFFDRNKVTFLDKSVNLSGTPLEKIILTQKSGNYNGMLVDNALPFPTYEKTPHNFSCLCLPLSNENNRVIGVIVISQKIGAQLLHERILVLDTLRMLLAAALDAIAENTRLLQLATTDNLTGLYTRHYFEERLQEEFARMYRHGGIVSLLMIDIDHFQQINEMCGYQQGNKVLREVSKLLLASIRKSIDIPCRYGSKRFTLLLPNTDVDGAHVLAERIRQRCEKQVFTTSQGVPLKVTVTTGIAHSIDIAHADNADQESENVEKNQVTGISKEELIHRADLMLQAAKQAGRNQIMVWW